MVSGGFLSRFKTSWTKNYSLFSWADKGQWETVQMENREVSRQGDWFRIGFEPVFVDYTKRGTWFIMISLIEVGYVVFVTAPRSALMCCAIASSAMAGGL